MKKDIYTGNNNDENLIKIRYIATPDEVTMISPNN